MGMTHSVSSKITGSTTGNVMKKMHPFIGDFDNILRAADDQIRRLISECGEITDKLDETSKSWTFSMQSIADEYTKASEALHLRFEAKVSDLEREFEDDMRESQQTFMRQRAMLQELSRSIVQEHSLNLVRDRSEETKVIRTIQDREARRDEKGAADFKERSTVIEDLLEMHTKETAEFCGPRQKESETLTEQIRLRGLKMKDRIDIIRKVNLDIVGLESRRAGSSENDIESLKLEKISLMASANALKLRIDRESRSTSNKLARLAILFDRARGNIEQLLDLCRKIERHVDQLPECEFP